MIAGNLIVNGVARCLNTIYANDLNVSGTTSFASVTASGLTVNGNASVTGTLGVNSTTSLKGTNITGTLNIINTASANADTVGLVVGGNNTGKRVRIMSDGAQAINNTSTSSLYLNYWGGAVYLSNSNQIHANNGTFTTPTLTATNGMINRLFVPEELRALQYNIQSINNLGGSFLIGPTINVPAGNNVSITAINTTTNVVTANISGSFSLTTFPTVIWAANSKIKISGSIGGIPIGTCDGKLRAALTASAIQVEFTYGGQGTKPLSVANNQASVDLAVMIYTVGATNPIGIYMTSWGDTSWTDTTAQNKSSISIYGGTTSSDVAPTVSTPVVRIGNLSGLPAVNGSNPVGWGIYAQHGYFSGMIVSSAGKIGNFNLTDKLYTGSHSTWNHASNGMYIASDGIAGGNGGTWYLWNDGTGKIGKYTFASNGALTTGSGTTQAGMGGTQAFWAGSNTPNSAPFRVSYGGALVATDATITGTITATKGTIGATNATNKITIGTNTTNASIYYGMSSLDNTTSNGFYIGTDGIALGKGVFKVTNTGALTATSATITGTIHATDGEFGDPNGYHIGIDGDSMDIYSDAGTKKAIFGEEIIIGADSSQHISLSNSNFIITDSGASSIFEIKTSSNKEETIGYSKTVNFKYSVNRISITSYVVDGSNIKLTFNITTISNFPQQTLTFVAKTASTQTWTQVLNNRTYTMTVEYDGKYMFEITQSGFSTSDSCRIGIIERRTVAGDVAYIIGKYNGNPGSDGIVLGRSNHFTANMSDQSTTIGIQNQIDAPYGFVIGNYNDVNYQYTTLIGSHLTPTNTDQYVFGRFNATDSGGFFIIGNGSSDSNRSNAMVISTNGDTTFSGSVTATSFVGNASTATKLSAAQKVYVTLGTASTTTTIQGGSTSAQTIGVNGTLNVGNGGTGKTSWTQYGIVYASTTSALTQLGVGTSGQVLTSQGSAAPKWVNQSTLSVGSATKATQDADGAAIASTYAKLSGAAFTGNISASNFFPVNSIYITSTNTNPSTILGFGTWTLFDKHYAPTMVTDAFTLNSTNVSALSGAWVKIAEHNILIRIQFTNKIAYADSTIDVGTFNLAKIGLASGKMPWYSGSGYSDNGNAIVMPNIDGSGKIQITDVVANGTATQIAAGNSMQLLFTVTVHTIADMLDSFCDKFFWKRTA